MSVDVLTELPDFPLNSAFGVDFPAYSSALTGVPLHLAIDLVGGTVADRIVLTEADVTLATDDTVARFYKPATWTATEFSAGVWKGRLFVNDLYWMGFFFTAITPDDGEIDP